MLQTVTVHVGDKVTDSKSSLNHSVLDLQTSSLLSCTISEKERCGIVTFSVRGIHSQEVRRRLAEERINVTVSLEEFSHLDLGATSSTWFELQCTITTLKKRLTGFAMS